MRYLLACLALATLTLATAAIGADAVVEGPVTLVPLDASTVVTANTAVTAIAAGHRTSGGWLANPAAAAAPLCISEVAVATTSSSGSTTCIPAGYSYRVSASNGPVSANATDAGHAFSGLGKQQ
jgi:hypothetical protein